MTKQNFEMFFAICTQLDFFNYFSQDAQFASCPRGEKCATVHEKLLGDRITGEDFSDMHRAERDFTAADDAFHVH